MSDPQSKKDSKQDRPSDSIADPRILETINQFGQIYSDYGRVQFEAGMGNQESDRIAHRDYLRAVHAVYEDTQRRCEEAYANHAAIMQDAALQEDAPRRVAAAQFEMADTMEKLHQDAYRRLEELHRDFLNRQQEAQKESYQRSREGYREYLKAMKNAWAQLDVDSVVTARELAGR